MHGVLVSLSPAQEIIRGPLTVTDASVGGQARFECILKTESLFPWWRIDGINFSVTHLPMGIEFENNGASKVLVVDPVKQELNNSCFLCYVVSPDGSREESSPAKLIIPPPPIPTPTSSLIHSSLLAVSPSSTPPPLGHTLTIEATSLNSSKIPQQSTHLNSSKNPQQRSSSNLICKSLLANTHHSNTCIIPIPADVVSGAAAILLLLLAVLIIAVTAFIVYCKITK